MRTFIRPAGLALILSLAACGQQGGGSGATAENASLGEAAEPPAADAALPACPFRETRDWNGSVEGGRVRVNGYVNLQMAGFRPTLTARPGASGGTLALDLALAPEPQAAVTDLVRYDAGGASAYRRAEIWCGDERVAAFNLVIVE